VGSLDRDRDFVDRVRAQAAPLGDRVHLTGVRTGAALDASFAAADVLVLASRAETYGMVVTEALARGVPAIAADVGGVHEALGRLADGSRPGLLVPPRTSLAPALRSWLTDADLRHRLRHAARERRRTLHGWPATARRIADVLADVARPTPG
jgi:glycosyltransferase involved in cell wall biosynthesis